MEGAILGATVEDRKGGGITQVQGSLFTIEVCGTKVEEGSPPAADLYLPTVNARAVLL